MIHRYSNLDLLQHAQGMFEIGMYSLNLPDLNTESVYREILKISRDQGNRGIRNAEFGTFQATNFFLPLMSHPFFSDNWIELVMKEVNARLWREKAGIRAIISQQRINGFPTLIYEVSVVPIILDNASSENWQEVA